jgi:hypothetical protein
MLIMSIALFGGYDFLAYSIFKLRQLFIIDLLEILFSIFGIAFVIWGLFESKIEERLSRYRDTADSKSSLASIERLKVPGKVLIFLLLILMALLFPVFVINLSEVVGLTLGIYEYYAPSIFEGQKLYMPAFLLIFIVGIAFECYIVMKILGILRKWRSGRHDSVGKN